MLRFWPIFVPILLYIIWMLVIRSRARRLGQDSIPGVTDGPWVTTLLITIGVAIAMFLTIGFSEPAVDGNYVPAHMQDGKLVEGQFR